MLKVWEMATLSAFLLSREVSRQMVSRGEGTILLTGATASTRGAAGHSAFSSAMASTDLAHQGGLWILTSCELVLVFARVTDKIFNLLTNQNCAIFGEASDWSAKQ